MTPNSVVRAIAILGVGIAVWLSAIAVYFHFVTKYW